MPRANWLWIYLRLASQRCVRIYCTTCGAMPFRRGLLRAVGRATGLKGESCHYGEEEAAEVRQRAKDEATELRLAKRRLRRAEIDALWRTLNL
jgi:hypothetical protein